MMLHIADAAYPATEHLIPKLYSLQWNNPLYNDFNYVLVVCKASKRPLKQCLHNVKYIVHSIAQLHNLVIKERLLNNGYKPAVPNTNDKGQ